MLGTAVRTHRRQLGLTQEELSWRADMHRTYLADIERGVRNVTLRSVANLAKALQMSVEGLLFRSTGAGGVPSADPDAAGLGEVLLVEGNRAAAELTAQSFKQARFANRLKMVHDGEEALQYLFRTGSPARRSSGLPQLVLLDLDLPKISGLEVLRQLKAHPSTREIPVVLMAGTREDAAIPEGSRLGAVAHLVKPVGFDGLAGVAAKLNFHWALLPPGKRVNSD